MKRNSKNPKGRRVKDHLGALEVRPSKKRGQNFMIDPSLPLTIADFGAPLPQQKLVEIGPGLGALTEILVPHGLLAVLEIEPRFCEDLRGKFPDLNVIEADARTFDFSTLGADLVVFGNLPYVFSTEIIFHLIEQRASITRAVCMLQREFVERLAATPGGRDFGVLSINVQRWADVRAGPIIPGTAFHPPTKVQSQLVELAFLPESRIRVSDEKWFARVVRAAFHQRRRKLPNSLASAGLGKLDEMRAALADLDIDPNLRAESLSLEQFGRLAEGLAARVVIQQAAGQQPQA